jgi:hypothetical protein
MYPPRLEKKLCHKPPADGARMRKLRAQLAVARRQPVKALFYNAVNLAQGSGKRKAREQSALSF